MSVAAQITALTTDRNNIRTALVNQGITDAANHGFDSFAADIALIEGGGGSQPVTGPEAEYFTIETTKTSGTTTINIYEGYCNPTRTSFESETLNYTQNTNNTYNSYWLEYSYDKTTWTKLVTDSTSHTSFTIPALGKVYIRSTCNRYYYYSQKYYFKYFGTASGVKIKVSGNILSLVNGDNFVKSTYTDDLQFAYLFYNCPYVSDASNLYIPTYCIRDNAYYAMFYNNTQLEALPSLPSIVARNCYNSMFRGCTKITALPALAATDLTDCHYCYMSMFNGCTGLTSIPSGYLPATTLATNCYNCMFKGCTGLTSIPSGLLPATTLANTCYRSMFYGCSSLSAIPSGFLPATTINHYCYQMMFQNCTSLTEIPSGLLPATTMQNYCYESMFYGCTGLTTIPSDLLPATTLASSCYAHMFRNCTSLTSVPNLPATTLASSCYANMFNGCNKITTAPDLLATTLVSSCYNYMFYQCSLLTYIKAMFTTTPTTSYTNSWVNGVAASGTFVKNSSASWDVTGVNGVPSGWTVTTAAA